MRLDSLRLRNFRQFYGEQEIKFAHSDAKRNVTVIHGYNGSGKTALLNAFIWCLYGETTPDLEAATRLANERALSELEPSETLSVSVRLRFMARSETYIAERQAEARRTRDAVVEQDDGKLTVWKIGVSGESELLGGPQDRIEQLLPRRLYPFFFFNGERVERLASPAAYNDVEEAVKTLLDVEIYERSARHLRDVRAKLTKELRRYGNQETQAAIDEESKLQEAENDLRERLRTLRENDAALCKEIEEIERIQRETAVLREVALRRDAANQRRQEIQRRIDELRGQAARIFSKNAYLAFADEVFTKTDELVAAARQRGELPAKIKPQFVDDLLEAGSCICGRPIEHGSAEYQKLSAWREVNGLAQLEEAISQTSGALIGLRERRADYFKNIEQIQSDTSVAFGELRHVKDMCSELSAKLGDASFGDAAELEEKHQALLRRREDTRVEMRTSHEQLAGIEDQLSEIRKDIQRLKLHDKKASLVQHQIDVVERIAVALNAIYELQKQDVREDLATSVSAIWTDAAAKDYQATVSDGFQLQLTKRVGGVLQKVHGASTGEKQVLALSFVGSLVRKAKENESKNSAELGKLAGHDLIVGGEYPLVMDSPFGALEDDYRRKVAEWVPTLAGQVVVMASKTQWRNEVEQATRPRIGREYVLELHTPKEDADRMIEIGGRQYPYVVTTDDAVEQTLIQEVK